MVSQVIASQWVNALPSKKFYSYLVLLGLRIGWIGTQDEELQHKIMQLKDYTTICSSGPSEVLALIALRSKDSIVQKNLSIIASGLHAVDTFMQKHDEHFAFQKPIAGPIGFPKILHGTASDYCEKLVQDIGVLLLPSYLYQVDDDRFRVSFGRENIPEVVKIWDAYMDATTSWWRNV